ncbi:MAG: Energy-coupling factor transporter ATP-binding protein EcfA2 [Chloroflexi bacterium AL-W]|nr:Energy-coupling factor transporter ATP-binding protein EcfA2 [Chloroflexi bacterium AL-N1]NOK71517.1 Energy-coupling factor transporter ATP-binding protein EcfA2 [Chloroflexi bacterium AL-N10]NOK78863.1 Energy-coupling factor transporter ATP-binding protein EcfA2 [Chloroflexi bacterium AL-N5]NOK86339.1 Energy-coupling factor transporter ATP-binding protein EcfA2 [Chloroflexi bacterium AL-W]NOK93308.1 Energy-coupling factor transporter ATP-binding protein EcfA2 [Chloroflexi bacterium AL-N15]
MVECTMIPVLELNNISYRYPGYSESALDDVTLQLPAGGKIVLLGHNGSGKSTLLLHCNGILQPDRGTVHLDGQTMTYDRRMLQVWRSRVGLVFQNPDDQLFSASVSQDISFGPLNLGLDTATARARVQAAADMCEVTDLLERPTHALSSGQKTRVALAGVLAMEPEVLLADEIVSGLDPSMRRQVFRIFHRLVTLGKTIVLSTHDIEVARHWASLIVVMQAGRILRVDTPDRIFDDQDFLESTGLDIQWYLDEP